ncbi:transposase [Clostridia bacterium]|nr:transposase [Clostridia bacterium]
MAQLKYKLTSDILFKMVFVERPDLLKRLVAKLLAIDETGITAFAIKNTEIPPELIGEKYCHLDIHMDVDGQAVDLEVQVEDENDYPERSLYYWARDYSTALKVRGHYSTLPRVVVISIVAFPLFDAAETHSEFELLEVNRHTRLTDRLSLHYFELPKLADELDEDDLQQLWLKLFYAKTEEELARLESLGVPEMTEAIGVYRYVTAKPEYQEYERLREEARYNENAALLHAQQEAIKQTDVKWQNVVADKDAEIASLRAQLNQQNNRR